MLLKLTPTEETALVQRLYAREEAAMQVFYDQYDTALFRSILRLVHAPLIAEDVLQESLVKIWFSFRQYDATRGRLFTWAVNICCHHAIDYLHSRHARLAAQTQPWKEVKAHHQQVDPTPPEHIGVRECLQRLHPMYQSLLELRYFQGLTQEETAEFLDLPLGTVKSRSRLALKQLAGFFTCPAPA